MNCVSSSYPQYVMILVSLPSLSSSFVLSSYPSLSSELVHEKLARHPQNNSYYPHSLALHSYCFPPWCLMQWLMSSGNGIRCGGGAIDLSAHIVALWVDDCYCCIIIRIMCRVMFVFCCIACVCCVSCICCIYTICCCYILSVCISLSACTIMC